MTDIEQPRGVVTNGIGQQTVAHLNLSRSLADVDGVQTAPAPAMKSPRRERRKPRVTYAGHDPRERQWR